MAYCLLDAARMDDLMDRAKELAGSADEYRCLYAGSAEETLSHVAPYLFTLARPALVDWLLTEGWGQSWGLYVITEATPLTLYQHFRRFLYVRPASGPALYFRFYDPRALRLFLPTCDADQLQAFFGPIRYFVMEADDSDFALNFWIENGQLRQEQVSRTDSHAHLRNYIQTRYPVF